MYYVLRYAKLDVPNGDARDVTLIEVVVIVPAALDQESALSDPDRHDCVLHKLSKETAPGAAGVASKVRNVKDAQRSIQYYILHFMNGMHQAFI